MVEEVQTTAFSERFTTLVEEAMAKARELGQPVPVSVTEEVEPVDTIRLFTNSAHYASERWYWERPEDDFAVAASGIATPVTARWKTRFQDAEAVHQNFVDTMIVDPPMEEGNPGPLLFAAFSFDPERKPDRRVWRGYSAVSLYLPRVMLTRHGEKYWLTFTTQVSFRREVEQIVKAIEELRDRTFAALEKEIPHGTPRVKLDQTEDDERIASEFRANVASASQQIQDGRFEKVVLARYRDVQTENYFDIAASIDRLRSDYPGCYTFAIARKGAIFLGASPEQLIKQEQKEVRADCLAGSIRRGEPEEEDAALGQQLLASEKDRHEHEICARSIRAALEPLCAELEIPDEPKLRSFSNVHHLHSPVRGTLSNGATIFQLVDRLHPTPAVGGYPKDVAREFLREHEGFDRGWYASPIGWVDLHGNGEFIVALRSALVIGMKARLFAGCGIVEDSEPDQELAESEIKMKPILSALSGETT